MTAARCSTTREIYCEISQQVFNIWLQPDNGNDHRAGTIDLNIEKHAQDRLRVHRFVIPRFWLWRYSRIRLHSLGCRSFARIAQRLGQACHNHRTTPRQVDRPAQG